MLTTVCTAATQFQSTSSARRTTLDYADLAREIVISIHVLREEDDLRRFDYVDHDE